MCELKPSTPAMVRMPAIAPGPTLTTFADCMSAGYMPSHFQWRAVLPLRFSPSRRSPAPTRWYSARKAFRSSTVVPTFAITFSFLCHSELPMPRYLGAPPGHENADPRSGTLESARSGPNVRGSARSGAASPFPRLNPGAPEAPPTVAIEHAEQTL